MQSSAAFGTLQNLGHNLHTHACVRSGEWLGVLCAFQTKQSTIYNFFSPLAQSGAPLRFRMVSSAMRHRSSWCAFVEWPHFGCRRVVPRFHQPRMQCFVLLYLLDLGGRCYHIWYRLMQSGLQQRCLSAHMPTDVSDIPARSSADDCADGRRSCRRRRLSNTGRQHSKWDSVMLIV